MTETVEGFRLSPQQRRIWLFAQQDGAAAYRARAVYRVEGPVDPDRLRKAVDALAMRHEILRTKYSRLSGMSEPLQVIEEGSIVAFTDREKPAAGGSGVSSSASAGSSGSGNAAPEDLARITLERSGPDTRLVLDFTALTADRESLDRVLVELDEAYRSGENEPRPSTGETLQYADVAEWWNELPEKPESASGLDFWRRLEREPDGASELPFETAAGSGRRFEPQRLPIETSPRTIGRLEALAGQLDVPAELLLLVAWCILLKRLTSSSPTVARVRDGRRLEELRAGVGAFSGSLPFRLAAADDCSFRDAVSQAARDVAEQDPWGDLFFWSSPAGGSEPSHAPFAFEFASLGERPLGPAALHPIETWSCFERFAVRLAVDRLPGGLRLHLDHDASRVVTEEARSLASRFATVLTDAVQNPDRPIGRLEILPDNERRRLLVEWNETGREFADGRPIHQRFEDAAARSPAAPAVASGGRRLTYSELNALANRIAKRLREGGVAPETVVALHVERSIEMVAGLLGIWKAGGAYLPLDPSLPAERLAFMLEDTGAAFLLTRSSLADRVRGSAARIHLLDEESGGGNEPDAENPPATARPENLAYVLFTSGSTGRPKGVAVEHRQLSNYVNAMLEKLDPPAGSSFGTVTTLAADLGNTSIFPSLATGGLLHVIPEERSSDPEGLADDLAREPLDYLKIVPSQLSALLSGSRPEKILPGRCLVLGGEPSSWALLDRIRGLAPACRVINHYGPTEATVGVTTHEVGPSSMRGSGGPVPVGRPLANCRVYILDAQDRPVAIGVAGELHAAGAGLAREYFHQPELTARRFVNVEIGGRHERVYRTGDLARYRRDGEIELLGRTDDQVKIHGFRIEPGEIEIALREHPGVRDAFVLPRDFPEGTRRLVAYVVARPGRDLPPAELRRFLAAKLPEFMLPGAIVGLPRLPLNANGKVDRAALPLPGLSGGRIDRDVAAPETPAAKTLWKVWSEVLGTSNFGVHDNFFDLGGDSILAIQIIARAAREGLRLTPRQLFERQTVAELAEVAQSAAGSKPEPANVTGAVPLTPIQHWFFEQPLADPHHFNQSVFLEPRERLEAGLLGQAVELVVAHHDALRLRFRRDGASWLQAHGPGGDANLFSVEPLESGGEFEPSEAIREAAAKWQASLDLGRGPIARAVLFERGPGKPQRLLFVVHHLAVDSVSWGILLEDLESAYRALSSGRAPALPPRTTPFHEWAETLVEVASSGALAAEAGYWLGGGTLPPAALPPDAGGPNTIESARSVESVFSEEETATLLQKVPSVYRTQINDALLAALAEAFARTTGARSVRIALEGHGREEIAPGLDLSRTVGWFTARFPLTLELPEAGGPGEALVAVKEQLRAVPQRGVGYGVLRYLSNDAGIFGTLRSMPDPDVSFNYLGQIDPPASADRLFRRLPSPGLDRSRRDRRRYLLAIEGRVQEGRLRFSWIFSENCHRRETIARLARSFEEALRELITHCESVPATYTPSDFPRANLSRKDLERLVSTLTSGDRKPR